MKPRSQFVLVFIAGLGFGWLANSWYGTVQLDFHPRFSGSKSSNNQNARTGDNNTYSGSVRNINSTTSNSSDSLSATPNSADFYAPEQRLTIETIDTDADVLTRFNTLLIDRLYHDAIDFYQERSQQNERTAIQLKTALLAHLNVLSETQSNSDFSELIESYLSIYYDDIDVILLLAEFNRSTGSYLETVDVYLLASTYAYTEADRKKLLVHFNDFVTGTDNFYTSQKNWLSLINLYSHIGALGLMTSPYQYRLALAHVRNGDEYSATEQLKQLVDDSLMGESARAALNNLTGNHNAPPPRNHSVLADSESIALQQLGNQYLVNLTVNHQDDIKLLIDTGASMTTLSRASFESLSSREDAIAQDQRIFRTAGGVIKGTVYSITELSIGSFVLKNTQIAVLDFETNREIDGLLGMNVLGNFRFQIDQENSSLLLANK